MMNLTLSKVVTLIYRPTVLLFIRILFISFTFRVLEFLVPNSKSSRYEGFHVLLYCPHELRGLLLKSSCSFNQDTRDKFFRP